MRARDAIADVLAAVLGRPLFARVARFLWLRSRLDGRNDIQTNGERMVQEAVLRRIKRNGTGTIFDVGANVGQWTSSLMDTAERVGIPRGGVELHLFEPAPEAADVLKARLQELPANVSVVLNRLAVAFTSGRRKLYLAGPMAGTNSLFQSFDGTGGATDVSCVTLDQYCRDNRIRSVDLCKIDAEGADCLVLEGGRESLNARIIKCVQFEYNHRWIDGRRFLRDAFHMARAADLEIGKVTPKGLEVYEGWDPELECFRESNYLIGENLGSLEIETFPWWKDPCDKRRRLNKHQRARGAREAHRGTLS